MKENKNIYILSLEAKDIYDSNNSNILNPVGYNIRNSLGEINIKKFKNSFDYSLEQIKIKEIYNKKYRNNKFSFYVDGKEYSQQVINVEFNYSYNLFNKAFGNVYIKNGYTYREMSFIDGICIINNEVVGVETQKEILSPIDKNLLEDYFEVQLISDKDGQHYEYVKTPKNPIIKKSSDLRRYLYDNGFVCDGIKYVRYKRSAGSSRVGKCLFVNEKLYGSIHKWELCGLDILEGQNIDLAAFEAYIALTTSSIIDTIDIKPENILLIDDYESIFSDEVVKVTYQNNTLEANNEICSIKNSLFDGQSLLDSSLFTKYKKKGMILLRNRFFKSACFNTNIQKFFQDNNIRYVWQLNGKTMANDISDIKLITTPSSIKYLKFGTFKNWLKNLESQFGIVKYEKPPHYFSGRMVQTHYQLLNTLQLSQEDVLNILDDTFQYIRQIYENPSVLRYHIHYPISPPISSEMKTKNEIVFKLLGINENFTKTKLYYDFKNDLIRSQLKNLRKGHFLVNGNYSTLFGNGYEMLKHSIGSFNGDCIIPKGTISTSRFGYNKTILGSRSPHIVSGNIFLAKNVKNDLITKYFNLSKEIVYVNSIGTNILQRLNGCDFDSDTLLLTDNQILVDKALQNYKLFKVPTCCVEAEKTKRYYSNHDKAELDIKTSVNKIGEVVNFSQYLNSLMWNNIFKNKQSIEENLDIYYDACKLAVLSGIEIDRSKKEFEVNTKKEIEILKRKYQIEIQEDDEENKKIIKPLFFKNITLDNGFQLNSSHHYIMFQTPMDYLQIHVKKFKKSLKNNKKNFIPLYELVKKPDDCSFSRNDYRKKNSVINLILHTKKEISKIYLSNIENKYEKSEILKSNCISQINTIANTKNCVYLLLKCLSEKENNSINSLLSYALFSCPNQILFEMIVENKKNVNTLSESKQGEISLYGFSFVEKAI